MTEDYLFVYGTLRKDTVRHDLLHQYCEYIALGRLQASLYQVSYYPGVILSDDSSQQVIGEVYRINNYELLFAELDDYEECSASFCEPHEYVRSRQNITLADGGEITAWVYLYNRPATGLKLIASGDYLNP
jgi:gamma-glutamylcyclotransferase (GGCT)/AIG2-like uncharacterized protein YtfP